MKGLWALLLACPAVVLARVQLNSEGGYGHLIKDVFSNFLSNIITNEERQNQNHDLELEDDVPRNNFVGHIHSNFKGNPGKPKRPDETRAFQTNLGENVNDDNGVLKYRKFREIKSERPDLFDAKHGVKMGIPFDGCDNAKSHLEVDWDGNPMNYTCYHPTNPILPDESKEPSLHCDNVPMLYWPKHFCMTDKIDYEDLIPTYGDHRPLWPKFGEYRFVPRQRWLHNIEHGSVVMLYHPCAHRSMVDALRKLVTGCIRKHVITPSTLLTEEEPLVLVAWGCRLTMTFVDEAAVVNFIRTKALQGPEGTTSKEGQYDEQFLIPAKAPEGSDMEDSVLCPNHKGAIARRSNLFDQLTNFMGFRPESNYVMDQIGNLLQG